MTKRWVWAGVALAALGACDEIATGPEATFADLVDQNAAMAARVTPLPLATDAEMPVAGTAVYDGFATLTMDTERETNLVGRARLEADFGGDDISGTLSGFTGRVDGGEIQTLDGRLAVGDGDLRVLGPAGFTAGVDGRLTGDGQVVGVDGSVLGSFRSEPGQGASALTGVAATGTDFTLNGTAQDGALGIVAER